MADLPSETLAAILRTTAPAAGFNPENARVAPVSGGCIHDAWTIETPDRRFFLKTGPAATAPVLRAERTGLEAIAATETIRVPRSLACGVAADHAFHLMEFLPLAGPLPAAGEALAGCLAALHRHRGPAFGFVEDNFIGVTPQSNLPTCEDWTAFFRERRLRPMVEGCARRGLDPAPGRRLCDRLGRLLAGHQPPAAVLHGDLWSGNVGFLDDGTPVIYDPAAHWGDPETDLAFARLFGGFPSGFFEAYAEAYPFPEGWRERVPLYQLYHLLNHGIHFGGGYLAQAAETIRRLLAAAG